MPLFNALRLAPKHYLSQVKTTAALVLIEVKWILDKFSLPLTGRHKALYRVIHILFLKELRSLPNLKNCQDFNDRIQWLKLFDQSLLISTCIDKIKVRDYVATRIGRAFLTKIYQTCETFDQIDFDRLPEEFVIKTNHDSGTVLPVKSKKSADLIYLRKRIEKSLSKKYGHEKGEWAYELIEPRILIEEYISPHSKSLPSDYKFHCSNGKIAWLQYIYDRDSDPKEVITNRNGEIISINLSHNFKPGKSFALPERWTEMCELVEKIAQGWKYVRVDMYYTDNRIIFGEMTFYPMMGCYKSQGQKVLGKKLKFDRKTFNPPIF